VSLVRADSEGIARAAAILRGGGVVAFPTETVYGLGANALDACAAAKIFEIKRRPAFDPLIVHIADLAVLGLIARAIPQSMRALMQRFWPGPLTLVLERSEEVPMIVTSGLPTVAVRMPSHPIALALIQECGFPIAAPSANAFGGISPTRAEHVERALGDRVDLILDGGPTPLGIESTILCLDPTPTLLRPGALPVEEIEAVIGHVARGAADQSRPVAPGRLRHHYAPRTPLQLVTQPPLLCDRSRAGYLGFQRTCEGYAAVRILSAKGDLREAAARLFEVLHELDDLGLERIDAEPVPEHGLGLAIMDRLGRAAAAG
jgi:L-threonylcarbamoyladenylate synthase